MPSKPVLPITAKSLSSAELSQWKQQLQEAHLGHFDVVRAVKKGNKQVVFVANKYAVAPRLRYALRGYHAIALGKSEVMRAAFGDALAGWSPASADDAGQESGRTDNNPDTARLLPATAKGAAPASVAPAFFSKPQMRARALAGGYLPGAIRNRQLDELCADMQQATSDLRKFLAKARLPYVDEAKTFLDAYHRAIPQDRRVLALRIAAGDDRKLTTFILAWRGEVERFGKPGRGADAHATIPDVAGVGQLDKVLQTLLPEASVRDLPNSCCNPSQVTALAIDLRDCFAYEGTLDRWTERLANAMAQELADGSDSSRQLGEAGARRRRFQFAMSYGNAFAEAFAALLQAKLASANEVIDNEVLTKAIHRAYCTAVAGLDQGSLQGAELKLSGHTLKHAKVLGKGGNGKVALYTHGKGAFALKSALLKNHDQEEAKRSFQTHADEIRMQRLFARDKQQAMPVRSADGALHIAMPAYKYGGADVLAERIQQLVERKKLTGRDAMLVHKFLLKAMAKELALLERRQLLHRDVKLQNFCMDTDGHLHLIDFGTALAGSMRPSSDWDNAKIDNPRYTAPEVELDIMQDRFAKETAADDIAALDATLKLYTETLKKRIKRELSEERKGELRSLKRKTTRQIAAKKNEIRSQTYRHRFVDTKADVWSLGVAAYQLFNLKSVYGEEAEKASAARSANGAPAGSFNLPFDTDRLAQAVRRQLQEFKKMSPEKRRETLNLGAPGRKSQDGLRDDFLMRLLDPSPTTRPLASEVVVDNFLSLTKEQEVAIRTLLCAVASGNEKAFLQARGAFHRVGLSARG